MMFHKRWYRLSAKSLFGEYRYVYQRGGAEKFTPKDEPIPPAPKPPEPVESEPKEEPKLPGRRVFSERVNIENQPVEESEENDEAEPVEPEEPEFGSLEINTNPKTSIYPNGPGEASVSEMSFDQLKTMLRNAVESTYQRAVDAYMRRYNRIRQVRQQRGMDSQAEVGPAEATLEAQMQGDFENVLNEAVRSIYRLKENALGVVHIAEAMGPAWDYFWDIVQDHPTFSFNHPLFKSDRWRGGMRLAGAYMNGRIARMSLPGTDRYRRKKSGMSDQFRRRTQPQYRATNNIDARYRGKAQNLLSEEFGIKGTENEKLKIDRMRWELKERGDETKGFPTLIEVTNSADFFRGQAIAGTGGKGLLMIEGNYDNPEEAEMVFLDYDYIDDMMLILNSDSYYSRLAKVPGYFNQETIFKIGDKVSQFMNTPDENERDYQYYKSDIVALLMLEIVDMERVVSMVEDAGISEAELGDLDSVTELADNPLAENVKKLIEEAKSSGQLELLRRALPSYMPAYFKKDGNTWSGLEEEVGVNS